MGRGRRVGLVSLWIVVALMGVVQSEVSQLVNLEDSIISLSKCDFHFKGYRSFPPILNLQNPGANALSSSIISRDGKALRTAATAKKCFFPGADGRATREFQQMEALCAEHFHMELDKLATTALANVTERFMNGLKGRHVVLPLTYVDFLDGSRLWPGDGNRQFPERRRCLAFFTASDINTLLDKVLNKAHRKKLSKISVSAQRFRYDFNLLLNNILQFP